MANKTTTVEIQEIATTLDGRDITRGFVDAMQLSESTDSILKSRGYGSYQLYKEVLRDEQVMSTFQQRRLAVIARSWEVSAGGESKIDIDAADFIRQQLKDIRFDTVTDKMLFGVFYGYSVAECLWDIKDNQVILKQVKVRDRDRFAFDGAGRLRLKTMNNPQGELLPDNKFWTFQTGADHDDEPYGLGLAHWLYWLVFFKRNGLKFWLIFLEKFGQPTALGTYGVNAKPEEKNKLLQALRDIATDSGIIIPEGMDISLLEASRSGTGDYTALQDRMNNAIAKVTVGQVASSEGTAGKLGNEDLQADVRLELIKADADLVCESFNDSVIRWLVEWNFPTAKLPKVSRIIEDPQDLDKLADRDKKLTEIGYKPTLRHVKDTYGGEYIEQEKTQITTEFAETEKESSPTKMIAQQLAEINQEPMESVLLQIEAMLGQAESLEHFQQMLLNSFNDFSVQPLVDNLTEALETARLKGYAEAMEQSNEA